MSEALNVARPKDDMCVKKYQLDDGDHGAAGVISKNMVVTNRQVLKSDAGSAIIVFPESNTSRQVLNPIPMNVVYLLFDTPYGDALPVTIASGDEVVAQMSQITSLVKLPLLPRSMGPEVALFSVSAACWNGSSGGGVITSNGRVDATGTIYPQLGFIIPSNVIMVGWEAIKHGGEVHLSDAVIRLWRMQKTHEDVHENIQRSSGLKVKL
ncbi:hypothetical protein V1515DRAFT_576858 [Lipomyces mesembrius]